MKNNIRHYALIPAKSNSRRCFNKNWRDFVAGSCLVDFTLKMMPAGFFKQVIISTDKADYKAPGKALLHKRDKKLASKNACVKELVSLIIDEYALAESDYLWLLNPTAPFRSKADYFNIKNIVNREQPSALVSAARIIPYIWKNGIPTFVTAGKRRNTEDFKEEYAVENGMFYVMNAGFFRKHKSWYGSKVKLYPQDDIWSTVDIDTEEDFLQAKEMGRLWLKRMGGRNVRS